MSLAGRATGSAWVGRLAENGAEALRHGKSLAEAVRAIEPLSASLPGWIQAGEASGKLEDLLENAGDRYQQQWDRLISRGLSVLEPVLILAVGLFVLLIALSILMPVMSLNQAMNLMFAMSGIVRSGRIMILSCWRADHFGMSAHRG